MTAARWRVVYVVQPFLGGRLPIGALVDHGQEVRGGRVRLVAVPTLPWVAWGVLDRRVASLVEIVLADLERHGDFERLPVSVGPEVILGEMRSMSDGIQDPDAWVREMLRGGKGAFNG